MVVEEAAPRRRLELSVQCFYCVSDWTEPPIVMSNHQSLYDIPVLFQAIPGKIRMAAKAELFRFPVGAARRRPPASCASTAATAIRPSRACARRAARLWPAGRGVDRPSGHAAARRGVGEFKSGGFRMALDTEDPHPPGVIDGTDDVLPATGRIEQKESG